MSFVTGNGWMTLIDYHICRLDGTLQTYRLPGSCSGIASAWLHVSLSNIKTYTLVAVHHSKIVLPPIGSFLGLAAAVNNG